MKTSTRILFGTPGDWSSRHQGVLLGAVLTLIGAADWLANLATTAG